MHMTIGQWTIDLRAGYFSVEFPVGEVKVKLMYIEDDFDMANVIVANIDGKEAVRFPLPVIQTGENDAP